MKVTKEFEATQSEEAKKYMDSVKGTLDIANGKLVVTSDFIDAGYEMGAILGDAVVTGVGKAAEVGGNVVAGSVHVVGEVGGVVIKAATPAVKELTGLAIKTPAYLINAVAEVGSGAVRIYKEDEVVATAKGNAVGLYNKAKEIVPKSLKIGNIKITF